MEFVPDTVRQVMRRLEDLDSADRLDGTPREKRLRAIRPEVGEFLMLLALAIDAKLSLSFLRWVLRLWSQVTHRSLSLGQGLSPSVWDCPPRAPFRSNGGAATRRTRSWGRAEALVRSVVRTTARLWDPSVAVPLQRNPRHGCHLASWGGEPDTA